MSLLPSSNSRMNQPAPFTINLLDYVLAASSPEPHSSSASNSTTTLQPAALDGKAEPFAHLLAASYRTEKDNLDVPHTGSDYLWQELGVSRLNTIHKWLWAVGRPMPPRALHHQKLLGREIVVTEQMDMHLVWSKTRILVKPLPRFLLDPRFWTDRLSCRVGCQCLAVSGTPGNPVECEEAQLRKCALGFLMSYAALVSHESDFFIAQESRLLSDKIPWAGWKTFVADIPKHESIYSHINKRYIYGELRLGRLNAVYRLTGHSLLRGYQPGYNQYSSFFRENFTWLASILAYVVVVLTAMQVGLATEVLAGNSSFQAASYGFTVFSIVGSLAAVVVVVGVFLALFVYHWIKTKTYEKARFLEIQRSRQAIITP